MELEEDLSERRSGSRAQAKRNARLANILLLTAIAGSALATASIWSNYFSREVAALLAAVPGIAVAILTANKFDARSQWWWGKYQKLDDLRRALRHEGKSEQEVSQDMSAFLKSYHDKYPGLGSPPT